MKFAGLKFIVAVFLVGLLATIVPDKHAQSGMTITAPDGYSINCVSGYVRAAPHYCIASGAISGVTITNTACSTLSFTLPNSTRAWSIKLSVSINSKNAVAARNQQFSTWLENTCNNLIIASNWGAWEHVAVPATIIAIHDEEMVVKATTTGVNTSSIFYKTLSALDGDLVLYVTGYYD
jgi:hypothetical protein